MAALQQVSQLCRLSFYESYYIVGIRNDGESLLFIGAICLLNLFLRIFLRGKLN